VSEAEFARILDYYQVRWEYEPHTFPILWNLAGDLLESFSPDFFLPEMDLYVELTTLRQKLVRKKNRKLRRLRELYPELRIKLFYARDFRALMLKYGRLELADELSGTPGHVTPARTAASMLAGPFGLDRTPAVPAAALARESTDPTVSPAAGTGRTTRYLIDLSRRYEAVDYSPVMLASNSLHFKSLTSF